MKAIFHFLSQPAYSTTRSALDLSFSSDSVGDEKTAFLAHLAHTLEQSATFPYQPARGSHAFRKQIAAFLRLYFRIPVGVQVGGGGLEGGGVGFLF